MIDNLTIDIKNKNYRKYFSLLGAIIINLVLGYPYLWGSMSSYTL